MSTQIDRNIVTPEDDQKFMDIAFAEAKYGFEQGGIPIVSLTNLSHLDTIDHIGCSPRISRR